MTVAPAVSHPRFEVRISGVTLAADLGRAGPQPEVETNLDWPASFALVLRNADNTLLDSALLDLGKTVEIHLGYGNDLTPAFLGEIAAVAAVVPAERAADHQGLRLRQVVPAAPDPARAHRLQVHERQPDRRPDRRRERPDPGRRPDAGAVEGDHQGRERLGVPQGAGASGTSSTSTWSGTACTSSSRDRSWPPTCCEWGRNLSSFAPRISAAGLAGLQVIRGYNQELAQTIYVAALAADLDLDNLVERLGSSALELLQSLVREGIRKHTIENPLDAQGAGQIPAAGPARGHVRGRPAPASGIPDLRRRPVTSRSQGVGKRFSGTYRVRKVTHTIDGSGFTTSFEITQREPLQPAGGCCASSCSRSLRPTGRSASTGSSWAGRRETNELERPDREAARAGEGVDPRVRRGLQERLGAVREADGRQQHGLLRAARAGRAGAGRLRQRRARASRTCSAACGRTSSRRRSWTPARPTASA